MRMVIACALAYAVTYALTPMSMRIAERIGAVDLPGEQRRMHSRATPRAGGLAIFFGCLIALSVLGGVEGGAWLIGGFFAFAVIGLIDDVVSLGAQGKLLLQVAVVALTMWGSGIRGVFFLLGSLWVLALVNAHNMIDGLDGLLVGCVAIEGCGVGLALLLRGLPGSEVSAVVVISCLGFLPYNRHPARSFAGDCGSESLGFLMGMLSLPLLQGTPLGVGAVAPAFLFAYPLTDLVAAVLRRVLRGKSPFCADRGHLHHRIFDAGVDHVGCTAVLTLISGALGGIGVLLCDPRLWEVAAAACFLCAGLLVFLRHYILNFS